MTDNDFILYTTDDGESQLVLRELGGQVWLTQLEMAELYQTSKQNISKHVKGILSDGELAEGAVVNPKLTTAADGKEYLTQLYALPMIIAVGYRVRSTRGTQFRQWATRTLGEYLTKGFAMDDERLKNPQWDYFDELLARIRDIRSSELAASSNPDSPSKTQLIQLLINLVDAVNLPPPLLQVQVQQAVDQQVDQAHRCGVAVEGRYRIQ